MFWELGGGLHTHRYSSLNVPLAFLDLRAPVKGPCEKEPMGQTGEAWWEFDADHAALNLALLHFPEHAAHPLRARELWGCTWHHNHSPGLCWVRRWGKEWSCSSSVALQWLRLFPAMLRLPRASLTQGNSQITLFPLLPSSVFPDCCSALKLCLVLDVPLPLWGNYCCFSTMSGFYWSPVQISRSWYKPVHFLRLFNRCSTYRRRLKEDCLAKLRLYNKRNWDLLNGNSCFLPAAHRATMLANSLLVYLHILFRLHLFLHFLLLLLCSIIPL